MLKTRTITSGFCSFSPLLGELIALEYRLPVCLTGLTEVESRTSRRAMQRLKSRAYTACFWSSHWPFIEVGALVNLEASTVLRLHQRHAELIQVMALARHIGIEDGGAGNVFVWFVE